MIMIIILLILVSLIIVLIIHEKTGNKEVSENMTKESSIKENRTEESGDMINEQPNILNQQQVIDYWKNTLPDDVNKEINRIRFTSSQKFYISKWDIDLNKEQVTFYAYQIREEGEIKNLQGKKIGNWSIRIIHDTVFEKEFENIFSDMKKLKQKPELQILSFDVETDPWVVPPEKRIVLWVTKQTPENQKLDKTELGDWRISVYISGGVGRVNSSST